MKFSSIPLQSTSTHIDLDEYMRIQTRPAFVCFVIAFTPQKHHQTTFSPVASSASALTKDGKRGPAIAYSGEIPTLLMTVFCADDIYSH
jgi:hypothetical protein